MGRKRQPKWEDIDLIVDDDELLVDDDPPPKTSVSVGDTVVCYGCFEPGGHRSMFLAEVLREVDFSEEFHRCGSSGLGFQLKFLEGSRPGNSVKRVKTKNKEKLVEVNDNIFLSLRDVKPFAGEHKKLWNKYNKKRNKSRNK